MADNIMQYYQTPELGAAKTAAESAQTKANEYTAGNALLPYKLKEAVLKKLNYNQDIIKQQSEAQANWFAAPSAAREKYQNVWNPTEREALVAKERAMAYQPYSELTDVLNTRMGNVSDIIGAGTGAYQAEGGLAQGQATLAQQKLADLYKQAEALTSALEWQKSMEQRQQEAAAEQEIAKRRVATEETTSKALAEKTNPEWTIAGYKVGNVEISTGGGTPSVGWIKANYPGYAGWNDSAAILADYKATGGAGKK